MVSCNDITGHYCLLIKLENERRAECLGYGICLTVISMFLDFIATSLAYWQVTEHSSPLLLAGIITGLLLPVLSFIGLITAIITCVWCDPSKTYIIFSIIAFLRFIPVISGTLLFLDAGLNSLNAGVVWAAGAIFIVTCSLHGLSCGLLAYSRCQVEDD